jgi:beta-lactamase class A
MTTGRAVALAFVVGMVVGTFGLARLWPADDGGGDAHELRSGIVRFVNPLLECPEGENLQRPVRQFGEHVETLLAARRGERRIRRASVYFRDLNNGPWFAAGDAGTYTIASLLKIPLLIGYLKRAEGDPAILQKQLRFDGTPPAAQAQNVVPAKRLETGQAYSVEELLERAIVYSDNDAAAVLAADDGGQSMASIRDLAGFPPFHGGTLSLGPRHFAAMLRILYNASYLSIAMSERALELLARSEFRDGLVAGVPPGVPVANKFGEREENGVVQLHDCGIVYAPERPYILCVMTEGDRFADLAAVIADVSRLVAGEIAGQR